MLMKIMDCISFASKLYSLFLAKTGQLIVDLSSDDPLTNILE